MLWKQNAGMRGTPADWPPPLPWIADWTFSVSAWNSNDQPIAEGCFRTLQRLGDVAPADNPAPWSFKAALPEHLGPPSVVLLANGYRLSFPQPPQAGACTCIMLKPGILIGQTTLSAAPALFAPEFEVHKEGNAEWINLPSGTVLLLSERDDGATRFCLSAGSADREAAMKAVEGWEAEDVHTLFDAQVHQRALLWNEEEERPPASRHIWYAIESLIARARPACGMFPCRWSVGDRVDGVIFDVNHSLPLALAWSTLDSAMAEDVVCSALSCQNEDGSIPAWVCADGSTSAAARAWPLLAQAAAVAWSGRRNPEFLQYALPRLYRYLADVTSHTDPATRGIHCWQSSGESLVPETFDAGLASADLPTLLLCEIEAFFELCDDAPQFAFDRAALQAEHDRLAKSLMDDLWDNTERVFRSRYIDGTAIERISLASILPLLWSNLPARYEDPILRQLGRGGPFHTNCGVPLWLKWEDESETPPAPPAHQVLVLEALRRAGATREHDDLARTIDQRLARYFGEYHLLPEDLRVSPAGPAASKPQHAVSSALAVIMAGRPSDDRGTAGAKSKNLRWLDRHRAAVIGTTIALIAFAVVAVTVLLITRRTLPAPTIEALAGLARQQYADKNYDEAIATYQKLWKGTRGSAAVELLMGNAYHRKGDYPAAEKCYRDVLEKNPQSATALYNLGLTLFRQNRMEEASACYEDLIRRFGPANPILANRARFALDLIAERTGRSS